MKEIRKYFHRVFSLKNLIHKDNLIIGLLIYLFVLFFEYVPLPLQFLDPLSDAFEDVEISDVVFSQMGKNKDLRTTVDGEVSQNTDVVIINVGGLGRSRRDIAAMVNAASMGGAKVIALDVFFEYLKTDTLGDVMLQESFSNIDNLVLVNELIGYENESGTFDSLKTTIPFFNQYADNAFANMVTKNDAEESGQFNVCRKFMTRAYQKNNGEEILSFPVKICQLYDSTSLEKLNKRNKLEEYINYVGNITTDFPRAFLPDFYKFDKIDNWEKQHFKVVEHNCAINAFYNALGMPSPYPNWQPADLEITFRDKIVLIGYVGDRIDIDTGEDKFFTPLNAKYIGKANRDMYGIVVHANIISTILNGHYIRVMPDWLMHLIGVIFVYFVFAMFRPIYDDYKIWYDGVTKTIGLVLAATILYIIGLTFEKFDYELRFGALYFACILLAGDFLEIYYGLIRNIGRKIKIKVINLRKNNR